MANNFRVSGFVLGLAIKAPCHTSSIVPVANLTGVGQNIGGYITAQYDRVLLTAQTNPIDNGIYSVRTSAWVRDGDADGNRDFVGGTLVPVWSQPGAELILWKLAGDPDPAIIGVDALVFTIYYDPDLVLGDAPSDGSTYGRNNAAWVVVGGGGEDLQATLLLGNLSNQAILLEDAGSTQTLTIQQTLNPATIDTTGAGINFTGALSEYFFSNAVRVVNGITAQSGGVIRSTNGLATEHMGINHNDVDGVLESTFGNISYLAADDHIFNGPLQIPAYRIPILQFSIIANSVTIDVNSTSACVIDIDDAGATGNFNVVLTAPAAGTGYYYEMNIDFLQGSPAYQPIWPASVLWPGGSAPVLSAGVNDKDTVHLYTRDAGVTWKGSFNLDYT